MAVPVALTESCAPKDDGPWRAVGWLPGEGLLVHTAQCDAPSKVRAKVKVLTAEGKLRDGRKTALIGRIDANFIEKAWRVGLSPNGRYLAVVGIRQEEGGYLAILGQDTPKKQVVHQDKDKDRGAALPIIGSDKASNRPHAVFITNDGGRVLVVNSDYQVCLWQRESRFEQDREADAAWSGSWRRVVVDIGGLGAPAHTPWAFDGCFPTDAEFFYTSARVGSAVVAHPAMSALAEMQFRDPMAAKGHLASGKYELRRDPTLPPAAVNGMGPKTQKQCLLVTSTVGSKHHVAPHAASGVPVISGHVAEYALPLREGDMRATNAVPQLKWDPEAALVACLLCTKQASVVFFTPGHTRVHETVLPGEIRDPEGMAWVANGLMVACSDKAGNVALVGRLGAVLRTILPTGKVPAFNVVGSVASHTAAQHIKLGVATGGFVQTLTLPLCVPLRGGPYAALAPDAASAVRVFCTMRWVLAMVGAAEIREALATLLGAAPSGEAPAAELKAWFVKAVVGYKECVKALYWVAGAVRHSFGTVTEMTHYLTLQLLRGADGVVAADSGSGELAAVVLEGVFHTVKWCEAAVWDIARLSQRHARMDRAVAVGRWFFKEYWLTLERAVGDVLDDATKRISGEVRQTLAVLHDVVLRRVKQCCTLPPDGIEVLPQNALPSSRPVLKAHDQFITKRGDCGVRLYEEAARRDCQLTALLLSARPADAAALLQKILSPALAAWDGKGTMLHAPMLLRDSPPARAATALASLLSGVMFALKVRVLPPIFCDVEDALVVAERYSARELEELALDTAPMSPTVQEFFRNKDSWTGKLQDESDAALRVTQHLALPADVAHACTQAVANGTDDKAAAFTAELWCANGYPLEGLHIALSHGQQATADRILKLCNWQVWSQEPWETTHLAGTKLPCANPPLNWDEMDQFLMYRTCRRCVARRMEAVEGSAKVFAAASARAGQAVRNARVCPSCYASLLLFFTLHAIRRAGFRSAQHVLSVPYALGTAANGAVLRQAAATQLTAVARAILEALPPFSSGVALPSDTPSPAQVVHGVLRGMEQVSEDTRRALREYLQAGRDGLKPFACRAKGREVEYVRTAAKLLAWALVFLSPAGTDAALGRCTQGLLPVVDAYERVFKKNKTLPARPAHPEVDQLRAILRYLWALEVFQRVHAETHSSRAFIALPPSWQGAAGQEPSLTKTGAEWAGKLVYFAEDLWELDVTQGAVLSALELCSDHDGVFAALAAAFYADADREMILQICQTKKGQYNRIVRELPEALREQLPSRQEQSFKVFTQHEGSSKTRFDPAPHPLLTKLEHAQEVTAKHLLHRKQYHYEGDAAYWAFVDGLIGAAPLEPAPAGPVALAEAHPAKPGWTELLVLPKFLQQSRGQVVVVPFGITADGEVVASKGTAGGVRSPDSAASKSPKDRRGDGGGSAGGAGEQPSSPQTPKDGGGGTAQPDAPTNAAKLHKGTAGDHVREKPTLVEGATSPMSAGGAASPTSPPRGRIVAKAAKKERPPDMSLPYELLPVGHGGMLLEVDESSSEGGLYNTTLLGLEAGLGAASPARLLESLPLRERELLGAQSPKSPHTSAPMEVKTPMEAMLGRRRGTGTVAPDSRTTMTTTSSNAETSYSHTSTTVTSTRQPTRESSSVPSRASTSIPDPIDIRAALTPPRAGAGRRDRDRLKEKLERKEKRRRRQSPGAVVEPGHDNRGVEQVHYHYNEMYGGGGGGGGEDRERYGRRGDRERDHYRCRSGHHHTRKHRHGGRRHDEYAHGHGHRDRSRKRRRREQDDQLLNSLPPPPVPSHIVGDAMARTNLAARAAMPAAAPLGSTLLKPSPAVPTPAAPGPAPLAGSPPRPVLLKPEGSGSPGTAKLTGPPTPLHAFAKPPDAPGPGKVQSPLAASPRPLTEPRIPPPPGSEAVAPGLVTTPAGTPLLGGQKGTGFAGEGPEMHSVAVSPLGTPLRAFLGRSSGAGQAPPTPKSLHDKALDAMSAQGTPHTSPVAPPGTAPPGIAAGTGGAASAASPVSPPHPFSLDAAAAPPAAKPAEPTTLIGQPVLTATEELLYAKYIKHLGITSADAVITGGIPVIQKYTPAPEDVAEKKAAVVSAASVDVPPTLEQLNDRHHAMAAVAPADVPSSSLAAAAKVVADAVSALARAETLGAVAPAAPAAAPAPTPQPPATAPPAAAEGKVEKTEEELKKEAKQQASLEDLLSTMLQKQEAVASASGKELAKAFAETLKNLPPAVAGSIADGTLQGEQLQREGMLQFLRQEGTHMQILAREREKAPELVGTGNTTTRLDGAGQPVRPLGDDEYENWAKRQEALVAKPQTADASVDAAERPGVALQATLDAKPTTEAQATQAGVGFLAVRDLDGANYQGAADDDGDEKGLGAGPSEGDRVTDQLLGISTGGPRSPQRAFLNVQDTHGHAGRYKDRLGERLPERRLEGADPADVAQWVLRSGAAKLDNDIEKATQRVNRVERTIHEASAAMVSSEAVLRDAARLRDQRQLQVSMDALRGEASRIEARLAAEAHAPPPAAVRKSPPRGVRPLMPPGEVALPPGASPYPSQGPSRGYTDGFHTRCVTPAAGSAHATPAGLPVRTASPLPPATVQMSPAPEERPAAQPPLAAAAEGGVVVAAATPAQAPEYLSTVSTTAYTPALPSAHATPGAAGATHMLQSMVEEGASGREPFLWQHTTQLPVKRAATAPTEAARVHGGGTPSASRALTSPALARGASPARPLQAMGALQKEVEVTPGAVTAVASPTDRAGAAAGLLPAVPRNLDKELERSPARTAAPASRRAPFSSVSVNGEQGAPRRTKAPATARGQPSVRTASPYGSVRSSSASTARRGRGATKAAPQRRHPSVPLALQNQIDELGQMLQGI
eukprot:TRINITY_DN5469_c1_g2_i4.p1 TRINITY_DN5469_c1_g2~~TRINITY_DN5469_c1_g2_i4.p1  ORF type:complete len:2875 (+),score=795.40 TRINITY_DN5469_c1_g2_i4:47-8671(+)